MVVHCVVGKDQRSSEFSELRSIPRVYGFCSCVSTEMYTTSSIACVDLRTVRSAYCQDGRKFEIPRVSCRSSGNRGALWASTGQTNSIPTVDRLLRRSHRLILQFRTRARNRRLYATSRASSSHATRRRSRRRRRRVENAPPRPTRSESRKIQSENSRTERRGATEKNGKQSQIFIIDDL